MPLCLRRAKMSMNVIEGSKGSSLCYSRGEALVFTLHSFQRFHHCQWVLDMFSQTGPCCFSTVSFSKRSSASLAENLTRHDLILESTMQPAIVCWYSLACFKCIHPPYMFYLKNVGSNCKEKEDLAVCGSFSSLQVFVYVMWQFCMLIWKRLLIVIYRQCDDHC